ncbi:voltage-dependent calcium channel gamma-2 subunit-like [Solea senegalensis]|uniref:Voltage-dependent calcium channel gamma-2 subunit-like n=1 Tax=Solea senegalensis TaxID=28829 RepID=A0AAV6Q922_SOLSE|nr:voltage-dependent calcium channel gamma-2 subunit-like [Solea senegalensis]
MYTLPKGQTGTPTATYNSTERDHNFLQVHNCIQKDLKDSGNSANRRTTPFKIHWVGKKTQDANFMSDSCEIFQNLQCPPDDDSTLFCRIQEYDIALFWHGGIYMERRAAGAFDHGDLTNIHKSSIAICVSAINPAEAGLSRLSHFAEQDRLSRMR